MGWKNALVWVAFVRLDWLAYWVQNLSFTKRQRSYGCFCSVSSKWHPIPRGLLCEKYVGTTGPGWDDRNMKMILPPKAPRITFKTSAGKLSGPHVFIPLSGQTGGELCCEQLPAGERCNRNYVAIDNLGSVIFASRWLWVNSVWIVRLSVRSLCTMKR